MPSMELRLQKLIDAVQVVANIDNLNAASPIVLRQYDPVHDRTVTLVCSILEPTNMVLPLNVVWIVFDKESLYYKQALQRKSKLPTKGFAFSWDLLYFYDNVFTEQYYDPADLGGVSSDPIGVATKDIAGTVKLNIESSTPTSPVIISEGHHSLNDNRDPNTHSHPKLMATRLKSTVETISIVDQSVPTVGMALVYGTGTSQWRKLTELDLQVGV